MAEQTSQSSQDSANTAPAAAVSGGAKAVGGDTSYVATNVNTYLPQNAANDVFATMNSAVKQAYQNNMAQKVGRHNNLDRDVMEMVEKASQENPVHKRLTTRVKEDSEALQVVDAVLKKLFSGATLMHMPPDAIHAIVNEAYAHVAEYQSHKEKNPNIDIGHLVMKIGPGSHFFSTRHQMILEHHPEHESYADGDDENTVGHAGHDHRKAHKARLRHAQARPIQPQQALAFGYPTGREAHQAIPASAVVINPEPIQSRMDEADHMDAVDEVHSRHMGEVPDTVVGNAKHHGIIETMLHFVGIH